MESGGRGTSRTAAAAVSDRAQLRGVKQTVSLGLCLLLSACVSGAYYRPDVPASESLSLGASCSPPYRLVRRALGQGVVLEVAPPYLEVSQSSMQVLLRISKGHRARLLDDRLRVATGDAREQVLRVSAIHTGWPADAPPQPGYPPEQRHAALDALVGLGRSDHVRLGWGEYSDVFGGGDVFRLQLDAFAERPPTFELRLPAVEVDGRRFDILPIRFETARGTSYGCVQ
jgi:hypothetical protein